MNNILKPNCIQTFLEKYGDMHDGLIKKIEMDYSKRGKPDIEVTITCLNIEKDTWVNVVISIEEVQEYKMAELPREQNVVIFEVSIFHDNGLYYIDYQFKSETIEEIRKSNFYVAGRKVSWEEREYKE